MEQDKIPKVTIRRLTFADLDAVMEIERASFPSPWSRRSFEAELTVNRLFSHCLVAVVEEQIVGYLCYHYAPGEAHIINLAVHPEHRRRGIGRRLLRFALHQARTLGVEQVVLEVRVSNRAALDLYRKEGFRILGIRRHYYTDNKEDAYVMLREL